MPIDVHSIECDHYLCLNILDEILFVQCHTLFGMGDSCCIAQSSYKLPCLPIRISTLFLLDKSYAADEVYLWLLLLSYNIASENIKKETYYTLLLRRKVSPVYSSANGTKINSNFSA